MESISIGMRFGAWTVLEHSENGKWRCQCSCENKTIRDIPTSSLLKGRTLGCKKCAGERKREDLTGKKFGDWTVLEYMGNKSYKCQCSCENKTIKVIQAQTLKNGTSKSCGHNNSSFKDITGQIFGLWKVLEYEGNGMWKCQCQCENKTIQSLYGGSLRAGRTTSCGCNKNTKRFETLNIKYSERSTRKIGESREEWQIKAISNKDSLLEYIKTLGYKPSITDLASRLNVTYSSIHRLIDENLENYIDINDSSSFKENELHDYITNIAKDKIIIRNSRSIISPYEIDIFLPELNLAFEFNGNYWHSTEYKDRYYHYNKTLMCLNNNIKLIHIFEYDWDNLDRQLELKTYIKDVIENPEKYKIEVKEPDYIWYDPSDKSIIKSEDTKKRLSEIKSNIVEESEDTIMTLIGMLKIYDSGINYKRQRD